MEEWVKNGFFEQTLNRIVNTSILRANLDAGDICDGRGQAMRGVCIRRLATKMSEVRERAQATDASLGVQSLYTTR